MTMSRLLGTLLLALALAAPAHADVLAKVGTFTRSTGSGDQAVTDVGFQPKALIVWTTRQTAGGFTDGVRFWIGISDCSNSEFTGVGVDDNLTTADTTRNHSDTDNFVYGFSSMAQAAEVNATVASCDSDGFTLNHSGAFAEASLMHYVALGGTGLTAKSGQFTIGTSAGDGSVTAVGFQPKFLLVLNSYSAVDGRTDDGDLPAIGFADGTSQAVSWVCSLDQNPSNSVRYQRTDKLLGIGAASNCAKASEGTLVSFDSDGFTVNISTPPVGAIQAYYLAVGGAEVAAVVGNGLQPTSTGTQSLTVTDVTPKLAVLQSVGQTAQTTIQDESKYSFGATDGTSQALSWIADKDNVSPTQTARRHATDKVIAMSTVDATGSSSTTQAEAGLSSFASGQVVINWTTADATQREYAWFVIGEDQSVVGTGRLSPFVVVP